MKTPKRIPYTISNFKTLITENYYYVDKTKYIEEIEKIKIPIFLRPRRFGKTLFTETLRYYYDFKYADEFQTIFGNLYIGNGNVENLIEKFFGKIIQKFPADFFKNANESFYHGLLFHILWNTFTKDVYEVLPEYNMPQGTTDLILHSLPGADVRCELHDIFELKQVPKSASDTVFNTKFKEATTQIKKYLTGDYKNWRGIIVCFRGNKDYKIKIL